MEGKQKTDPYAAGLLLMAALVIAAGWFTWSEYQKLKDAERRLTYSKDCWEQSLEMEKKIHEFPQSAQAAAGSFNMDDVSDAILGVPNEKLKSKDLKEGLKTKYRLNLDLKARQRTEVVGGTWTSDTLPIEVKECRLEELGKFVSAVELTFPQVRATKIMWSPQADKTEGTAQLAFTMYSEKEK